jgi:hypothetical protein
LSHRRRFATLLLIAGLGFGVVDLWRRSPRELRVHFRWGEARHGLRMAEIRYLRSGQEVRRVTFRYDGDAPYQQLHATRLARGPHDVRLRLETDRGPREIRRSIEIGDADEITLHGPW